MNIEVFENALRVLKEVAADRNKAASFNFNQWFDIDPNQELEDDDEVDDRVFTARVEDISNKIQNQSYDALLIPHNCGATACAAGYMGLDPWFRQNGFKTQVTGGIEFSTDHEYQGGFSGIARFFGITYAESEFLFSPAGMFSRNLPYEEMRALSKNVTVEQVIERIEQFMVDHKD